MQPRIIPQIPEYNYERYVYYKNKTKISLPDQSSMSFRGKRAEVIYIIVSIKLHISNDMDSGNYICDVLD